MYKYFIEKITGHLNAGDTPDSHYIFRTNYK